MTKDEIVNQVRQARERQAARFNYDLKALVAGARKRQMESGHPVVSLAVSSVSDKGTTPRL
jgi:hypothetical protein